MTPQGKANHKLFGRNLFCLLCELQIPDDNLIEKVRIYNPTSKQEPYYPFLAKMAKTSPFSVKGDFGQLCLFCSSSLRAQWEDYETGFVQIPPRERKYYAHTFICASCGLQAFRRRVRALPITEFPELNYGRKLGSILLHDPIKKQVHAVVCFDCFEKLYYLKRKEERVTLPQCPFNGHPVARPLGVSFIQTPTNYNAENCTLCCNQVQFQSNFQPKREAAPLEDCGESLHARKWESIRRANAKSHRISRQPYDKLSPYSNSSHSLIREPSNHTNHYSPLYFHQLYLKLKNETFPHPTDQFNKSTVIYNSY